jgi:hypothetical protein
VANLSVVSGRFARGCRTGCSRLAVTRSRAEVGVQPVSSSASVPVSGCSADAGRGRDGRYEAFPWRVCDSCSVGSYKGRGLCLPVGSEGPEAWGMGTGTGTGTGHGDAPICFFATAERSARKSTTNCAHFPSPISHFPFPCRLYAHG